ncbi:MAG: glycosyltransferase family 4 protein [archaeon]
MKIAILASEFYPQVGGVGTYAVKLVKGLVKDKNFEVHVITPAKNLPNKKYDPNEVKKLFDNKITLHNISEANDTFVYNHFFQMAVLKKLPPLQKKYNFDIVHVTNLVHMPDIYLKIKGFKIPHVLTAHTIIRGQLKGTLKSEKNIFKMSRSEIGSLLLYPYISLLEWIYVKKTKELILTSYYNKKYFKNNYNYQKNSYVTHTGMDIEDFTSKSNIEKIKEIEPIKKPIITFIGRLISQKGINVLIDAVKPLKGEYHLVFAGSGAEDTVIEKLKKNNITDYTFTGFINHKKLAYLLSKTSIYALPSFYEDFPNTILESMCFKVPIVASRINGIPEMIKDNKEGFLFDAGDVKQLTKYLQILLDDPKKRKKMGLAAFNRVNKEFHINKMVKDTKNIYRRIIR